MFRLYSVPFNKWFQSRGVATIFALSSGYGKSGIAVIKVSGPYSSEVVKTFGGYKILPEARKAALRKIRNPSSNEVLDQGIVIWFPGPNSYTGEDSCEFHVHGGMAVIRAVLNALTLYPNLRLAEPGEFTKRAFYSGKLDLTAVEGLNDLINSETEFQRKQALLQMEGSLFQMYTNWKNILLKCVSDIEAYIDFGEDQHLEPDLLKNARKDVEELRNKIESHLQDGRRGERLRSGVNLAVLGAPNVGKSSLFNKLCRKPAAIVSHLAGTTRDLINIDLDLGGYPVVLTDTAGIRVDAVDEVEMEGVTRARKAVSDADIVLLVFDSVHMFEWINNKTQNILSNLKENFPMLLSDYIVSLQLQSNIPNCEHFYQSIKSNDFNISELSNIVVVFNKIDLLSEFHFKLLSEVCECYKNVFWTLSCKTEKGLEFLVKKLVSNVKALCGSPSIDSPCYTQIRHRLCLMDCLKSLDLYLTFNNEREVDLAGHNLKMALHSLGMITGQVSTEQILDKIFANFCIGK